MSRFSVDLEQLDELVERMGAVEARLEAVHDDVESRMRRLQVVWTGQAAAEHVEAYAQWSTGSREVHEALQNLRRIATLAHQNYRAAMSANASMWSQ